MEPRSARCQIAAATIAAVSAALISSASSCSGRQELSIEDAPPDFAFLMFPSGRVAVYRTPETKAGQEVGEVERAVTVSSSEISDGIIDVRLSETSAGYARVVDFSFLPQANADDQIDRWHRALRWQGYAGGTWNASAVGDGSYRVRLRLEDDVHARSDTFEYLTDGRAVKRVFAPTSSLSAVGAAALAIVGVGACVVLAAVLWSVRWLRRRRLPVPGPW